MEHRSFGEVNFVEVNDPPLRAFDNPECLTNIITIGLELLLQVTRHVFLLPYLLSIDPVLEIESPQAGHSNTLVREAAVEEFGPPFEREARPILQRLIAG